MLEWIKQKIIEKSEKNIKKCLGELVFIANQAYENLYQTGKENISDVKAVNRAKDSLIIQLCGPIPLEEAKSRLIDPISQDANTSEGAHMAILHAYELCYQKLGSKKCG